MTEENRQQTEITEQDDVSQNSTLRVKFYQLNKHHDNQQWEDKGTGHCVYQVGTDEDPDQIIVHSEEDNSILVTSEVVRRHGYQRQQDTLICWTEDDGRDLALSFQNPSGCDEIWNRISSKSNQTSDSKNNTSSRDEDDDDDALLPEPTLANLNDVLRLLTNANTMREKDELAAYIIVEGYLPKLLSSFEACEDLESVEDLQLLYKVMVALLSLNNRNILDLIIQDQYFTDVMGVLEYNPKSPEKKAEHRSYLKEHAKIKPAIKIPDESILEKIEQSFRLEYLQAILLNSNCSDEGLTGVINTTLHKNHLAIIKYIQKNDSFLTELFGDFKDPNVTTEKKDAIIYFIHHLYSLAKPMEELIKMNLFRALSPFGFIDLLSVTLSHPNESIRETALDMLSNFVHLDWGTVRTHMMAQSKDQNLTVKPLIGVVAEETAKEGDYDSKVQYFEILKVILNTNAGAAAAHNNEGTENIPPELDEFIMKFYDKYSASLFKPITSLEVKPMSLDGPYEPLHLSHDKAELLLYLCDYLNFAARSHGFHSKYIFLATDFFTKIAQLYRSRYPHIKAAALRFFRTCISLPDDFYHRNLIKYKVLEPTIRVLLDTNGRDCLLNSACLEFLEYIRKENIKVLIEYLITEMGPVLDTITYVPTCRQLRLKYEQNQEPFEPTDSPENPAPGMSPIVRLDGWARGSMSKEEEDYFNGPDSDEESFELKNDPFVDEPDLSLPSLNKKKGKAVLKLENDPFVDDPGFSIPSPDNKKGKAVLKLENDPFVDDPEFSIPSPDNKKDDVPLVSENVPLVDDTGSPESSVNKTNDEVFFDSEDDPSLSIPCNEEVFFDSEDDLSLSIPCTEEKEINETITSSQNSKKQDQEVESSLNSTETQNQEEISTDSSNTSIKQHTEEIDSISSSNKSKKRNREENDTESSRPAKKQDREEKESLCHKTQDQKEGESTTSSLNSTKQDQEIEAVSSVSSSENQNQEEISTDSSNTSTKQQHTEEIDSISSSNQSKKRNREENDTESSRPAKKQNREEKKSLCHKTQDQKEGESTISSQNPKKQDQEEKESLCHKTQDQKEGESTTSSQNPTKQDQEVEAVSSLNSLEKQNQEEISSDSSNTSIKQHTEEIDSMSSLNKSKKRNREENDTESSPRPAKKQDREEKESLCYKAQDQKEGESTIFSQNPKKQDQEEKESLCYKTQDQKEGEYTTSSQNSKKEDREEKESLCYKAQDQKEGESKTSSQNSKKQDQDVEVVSFLNSPDKST